MVLNHLGEVRFQLPVQLSGFVVVETTLEATPFVLRDVVIELRLAQQPAPRGVDSGEKGGGPFRRHLFDLVVLLRSPEHDLEEALDLSNKQTTKTRS